jgi:hypothetical protein
MVLGGTALGWTPAVNRHFTGLAIDPPRELFSDIGLSTLGASANLDLLPPKKLFWLIIAARNRILTKFTK